MKKYAFTFNETYNRTPISFWVHKHLDDPVWMNATVFEPPLPKPVPGQGYAMLKINALGTDLFFASPEELEHFIDVIGKKHMPTSYQLSRLRSDSYGPNRHWLSRLPGHLKPYKKTRATLAYMQSRSRRI